MKSLGVASVGKRVPDLYAAKGQPPPGGATGAPPSPTPMWGAHAIFQVFRWERGCWQGKGVGGDQELAAVILTIIKGGGGISSKNQNGREEKARHKLQVDVGS